MTGAAGRGEAGAVDPKAVGPTRAPSTRVCGRGRGRGPVVPVTPRGFQLIRTERAGWASWGWRGKVGSTVLLHLGPFDSPELACRSAQGAHRREWLRAARWAAVVWGLWGLGALAAVGAVGWALIW